MTMASMRTGIRSRSVERAKGQVASTVVRAAGHGRDAPDRDRRRRAVDRADPRVPSTTRSRPRFRDELAAAIDEADADPDVHVILLRAEGPAFCAGYGLDWSTARAGEPKAAAGSGCGTRSPTCRMMRRFVDTYMKLWSTRRSRRSPRCRAGASRAAPTWCCAPTSSWRARARRSATRRRGCGARRRRRCGCTASGSRGRSATCSRATRSPRPRRPDRADPRDRARRRARRSTRRRSQQYVRRTK